MLQGSFSSHLSLPSRTQMLLLAHKAAGFWGFGLVFFFANLREMPKGQKLWGLECWLTECPSQWLLLSTDHLCYSVFTVNWERWRVQPWAHLTWHGSLDIDRLKPAYPSWILNPWNTGSPNVLPSECSPYCPAQCQWGWLLLKTMLKILG